jgi:hypothetical protein
MNYPYLFIEVLLTIDPLVWQITKELLRTLALGNLHATKKKKHHELAESMI